MYIKLPSVSYAVGGIPDINDKLERIKLVEKLNIKELAHSIISLLDNPVIRKELSDEAFLWVKNKFNNKNIVSELTTAYNCVLTKNDK
jgi:glycosyltransferase involved in cell wall biosynthesis